MTRTTPELASFSPRFRTTLAPSVLLPGFAPDWVGRGEGGVVSHTGGRAFGPLRMIQCATEPHALVILSRIGFRACNLPAPRPGPYHLATAAPKRG
ncbi:hypothetical protein AVEN_251524-1 [Araneus ventricosus]|uniref:Uncharacterized protein n=1 Tax=Araneus ventricosus TaxID=182803 RepID=A0A4Y2NWH8_ARAVE|nr:hypothetical protein AVEN_251524-1 [Araneus ventricosus]